jgi:endonuclease-3
MTDPVEILRKLKKEYPDAKYYLKFRGPLQLLVAAILSAQVRDEVVNAATPALFAKYKTAQDFASATPSEVAKFISKITFSGNKAKYIVNACKMLVEKYSGKVPKSISDLVKLPGVGRKTAIVILTNAFDIIEGVVVDTHVIRLSNRLGWVSTKNPDKIEKELSKEIPKSYWKETQWLLKAHGRKVCTSVPKCGECCVEKMCLKKGVK